MSTNKQHHNTVARAGAIIAATAAVNTSIYAVGRAAGVPFTTIDHGVAQRITLASVIFMSFVPLAVALAAAALAARIGRPSKRIVRTIGPGLALLSLVPFPTVDASLATKLCLVPMHLLVGAAYVVALTGTHRVRVAAELLPVDATAALAA
jgi:Family of unknown function (DUF6069)